MIYVIAAIGFVLFVLLIWYLSVLEADKANDWAEAEEYRYKLWNKKKEPK